MNFSIVERLNVQVNREWIFSWRADVEKWKESIMYKKPLFLLLLKVM